MCGGILKAAYEATEFGELRLRHWFFRPLAPGTAHVYVRYLSDIVLLGGTYGVVWELLKLDSREREGSGLAATEGKLLLEFLQFVLENLVASTETVIHVHPYDAVKLWSRFEEEHARLQGMSYEPQALKLST